MKNDILDFVLPEKEENKKENATLEDVSTSIFSDTNLPEIIKNKRAGSRPDSFTKKNKLRIKKPKRNGINKQRNKK